MGIEPWNNVGKRKKETILYDGITWGIKETPRRLSREFWPAFPLDSANGRVIFPVHDAFKNFFAELYKL